MYIVKEKDGKKFAKEVEIFQEPNKLAGVLHPLRWKILKLLARKPMHAAELARLLGEQEQKIYYHIKQLERHGFIRVVERIFVRGTVAKVYAPRKRAFAIELEGEEIPAEDFVKREKKVYEFFFPHISEGVLNSFIVVGSPDPHGPYQVRARDGHYAVELAHWLGQYARPGKKFSVKLDVDVKAEKAWDNNLVVIGGVLTNLVTAEINDLLPAKFSTSEFPFRKIISSFTNREYEDEKCGLIAKIPNPFAEGKGIIVLAGVRNTGTKAAVLALTRHTSEVLREYEGEDTWARIVRGLDLDGDGKIDSVEILE